MVTYVKKVVLLIFQINCNIMFLATLIGQRCEVLVVNMKLFVCFVFIAM